MSRRGIDNRCRLLQLLTVVSLSLLGLTNAEECGKSIKPPSGRLIVGGEPAQLGAWPWMALLGVRHPASTEPVFICGGSLISTRHVVTAAHCISEQLEIVRLGELNTDPSVDDGATPIDILIKQKITHPKFDQSMQHDIAILFLEKTVTFTDLIRPICLPKPEMDQTNFANYSSWLTGWGATQEGGRISAALNQVQVPILELDQCKKDYPPNGFTPDVTDNNVCAGLPEGGKDSCQGDSGGPLVIPLEKTFYLIGITSWGQGCARPHLPGVYTRVTKFVDWIKATAV